MMENLPSPGKVDLDTAKHILYQMRQSVTRVLLLIQILHAPATIKCLWTLSFDILDKRGKRAIG